jgi:FkbM family methyltransferase
MQLINRVQNKLSIIRELPLPFRQVSFSATGEDLIVADVFRRLKITRPFYFDIGTNHPVRFNNTYMFYRNGGRGVCVEPQPQLCEAIRKRRPRDVCLNAGAGARSSAPLTFYTFENPYLSTFSQAQAELLQSRGTSRLVSTTQVPILDVNEILARCPKGTPSFVSLDCEGMDLAILQGIDFERFRPTVFCVETAAPSPDSPLHLGPKVPDIATALIAHGYWAFADTYVNTIFVDGRSLRVDGEGSAQARA